MPQENLTNIDTLIETYDVQNDPILAEHFKPIEEKLWKRIETYGVEVNEYGSVMSKHLMRTSAIGMAFLTDVLGFSEKAGRNFYDANLLHDLGKTHPDYHPEIWQTVNRPTQEERDHKRSHASLGVELLDLALIKSPKELQSHPHIEMTQAIQLLHHERVDGTGYEELDGSKLGKVIKAICIIDAFDGDMIHRPHQLAKRTPEEALKRLKNGKKYKDAFDPEILQQFIDFQLAAV